MPRSSPVSATVLVVGLFVLGAATGGVAGRAAAARATDPYAGLDLFAHVLTRIETDYVDEVSPDELIDAAIEGMTSKLDPHTRWLSADEYRALEEDTEGSYEGIGVEVKQIKDGVRIDRVLPNGPASLAGLESGDRILAVDGQSIAGLDLDEVSKKLKGPRGDHVTLSVLRDGWDQPHDVATIRDRVYTPSVEGELYDGHIVYVRLTQFQKSSAADLEAKVNALSAGHDVDGLVLDLRDNPGGLLEEAVGVSDLFLDQGTIVSTKGRVEGELSWDAHPGGLPQDLRVAVLVNGMSASGSEIVTGALQDTHRAVIVGTQTYGKGSVQTLFNYRGDSALKLTIARYYTPSGKPIADRQGRIPDVVIDMPHAATAADQLQKDIASLDVPADKKKEMLDLLADLPKDQPDDPTIPWDLHGKERVAADPQLAKALDVVQHPELAADGGK